MKLWLLEAREDLPKDSTNPWHPWYDKTFGFVIRAETEYQARLIATLKGDDELQGNKDAWLDSAYSTCVELLPDGELGVVLKNHHAA